MDVVELSGRPLGCRGSIFGALGDPRGLLCVTFWGSFGRLWAYHARKMSDLVEFCKMYKNLRKTQVV